MVVFPKRFVQLDRYPGYYWDVVERHLYSIKVTGVLRKLTKSKGYRGWIKNGGFINTPPGYKLSKNGVRRYLTDDDILQMIAKIDYSKKQKVPFEKTVKGK